MQIGTFENFLMNLIYFGKIFRLIWDIFNLSNETFLFENSKNFLLSVDGPNVHRI
mgnify:CR=1 FL=1